MNHEPEKLNRVIDFLKLYLKDGPQKRSRIMAIINGMDISHSTLYNARSSLNIESLRDKRGDVVWRLPGDD